MAHYPATSRNCLAAGRKRATEKQLATAPSSYIDMYSALSCALNARSLILARNATGTVTAAVAVTVAGAVAVRMLNCSNAQSRKWRPSGRVHIRCV